MTYEINPTVEKIWSDFDTDDDGYLTFEESVKMMKFVFAKMKHNISDLEIRALFNYIDKNSDNRLSKDEVLMLIKEGITKQ